MQLVDGANYVSELEQRRALTKIFAAYDQDRSEAIDQAEFEVLKERLG